MSDYRYNIPFGKNGCCHEYCLLYNEDKTCTNDCRYCAYCGKRLYEKGKRRNIEYDHILPYGSGGKRVVPACAECNESKGKKGLKEWLRWIKASQPASWRRITGNNKWKRNRIAEIVMEVRGEQ